MKKIWANLLVGTTAAFLGGVAGAVSAGFLHFLEWGEKLVWSGLLAKNQWQALVLCILGGLLVGLCQRILGDHPKLLNEAILEIRKTGRLEYRHLPNGVATAAVSLIFGAGLGPEAAIIDLIGGSGTWVGDVIRAVQRRLGLIPEVVGARRIDKILQAWPGWIALVMGSAAFLRLLGGLYSGGILHIDMGFRWSDLLWSVPLGLLGAAAGAFYLSLQGITRRLTAPLQGRPIWRGMLGGFVLGATALFLPLVLFSGQHEFQHTYDNSAEMGFWLLLLTAAARLFLINFLLATGWKGGQFLPVMFAGAMLGLSVSILFPVFSPGVAVLACMAGLTAVVLPKPVFGLILMGLLFPLQYLGISLVAVGSVMVGQRILKMRKSKGMSQSDLQPVSE